MTDQIPTPEGPSPENKPTPPTREEKAKPDSTQIFLQEVTPDLSTKSRGKQLFRALVVPLLAILTG